MSKSVRIVFLVDVNDSQATLDLQSDVEKRTESIRLSCLKIINYFIHRRLKNYTKLKWGYRLYSSNSSQKHLRSHRQSFVDFELEHFEEFEETLISCVKKSDQINQNTTVKECQSHAQYLNVILREVLNDFDWDSPDLTTPDKMSKKRKKSATKNNLENFVFIVSECPWSEDELYNFLGRQENDVTKILSPILMSVAVKDLYVKTKEIKLFWLDVDDDNLLTEDDKLDGYETMREVLSCVNGKIIPISSLLDTYKSSESIFDWYFDPNEVVKNYQAHLQFRDVDAIKMELFTFQNTQIFHFSELLKTDCEFHPMSVAGATYKALISSQYTLGCLASEGNRNKFYQLLRILLNNNLNLFINVNGCCGLLHPVSPILAVVCFLEIFPRNFSLDKQINIQGVGKRKIDYPKSDEDIRLLNKKVREEFDYISDYVKTVPMLMKVQPKDRNLENKNRFTFQTLAKWFVVDSVSFVPNCEEVSSEQDAIRKRESELFSRLARRFKENEALKVSENKDDVKTASPIHLPKVSAHLKVSERSSRLVIQSLKNLKAKNEDEAKKKEKTKPPQRRTSSPRKLSDTLETNFNVADEEKLICQLKEYYSDCVESNNSLTTCAENIINVVILHQKEMNAKNNGDNIATITNLLNKELFKTAALIGETYETSNSNDRYREYELQSLLRMEAVMAKFPDEENCENFVEEVIELLRMLSLDWSADRFTDFLRETLLTNYCNISTETIITIFKELNQPLPPELGSELSSESNSDEEEQGEIQNQNPSTSNNVEADIKTIDSDYQSCNSASSSVKSSSVTSDRTRKLSLNVGRDRLGGMNKKTIRVTAKQKARFKVQKSYSTSEMEPRISKKRKKIKTTRNKTPSNKMSLEDVVFETPMEELEKKLEREKRRNFVIRETPIHKLVARRLYMSDSQPPSVRESPVRSVATSQSVSRIRRILSSPAKFKNNANSDFDVDPIADFIASSPVTKGQTSPEALPLPSWKHLNSASISSSTPTSPEIGLGNQFINDSSQELDEMIDTSIREDDVFYMEESERSEKCEKSCNHSPFDSWKRRKFSVGNRMKRKSESEFVTAESLPLKKRAKSEFSVGNSSFISTDKTPTKNGTRKLNFTSPTSLSLLHIITSPVKNRKL